MARVVQATGRRGRGSPVVGALVSLLTGRGLWFSGLRQVAIGAAAAGVTYIVGRIIGVGVGG